MARGPAALLLLLLAAAALATALPAAARRQPKGASITLQAKWDATPLLHEAAEFLADEDPALFWEFAQGWRAPQAGGSGEEQQCWDRIRDSAAAHLSPHVRRVLGLSLAVRQYSPRLEMYRQLAAGAPNATAGACCWAVVGGAAVEDAAALPQAVARALAKATAAAGAAKPDASTAVFPFDHMYAPAGAAAPLNLSAPNVVPAVLYAPLGSACGWAMHTALAAATDQAAAAGDASVQLAYAWRPLRAAGCAAAAGGEVDECGALGSTGRLLLPGYGVEMAIKNMEYNAQDDPKKGPAADPAPESSAGSSPEAEGASPPAAPAPEGEAAEEDVGGFLFGRLLERKPELEQELATFRDHLLASASEEQVLQVWDLKDLALQATQRIAAAADPLHLLQEVPQNFPLLVEALSRMAVDDGLRQAVAALQRQIPANAPLLLVNGLLHEVSEFNLYELVDRLRKEVRLFDALNATGLPPLELRQALLLRGEAAGAEGAPRLALQSDDFIAWVNDLEEDEQYASWPGDLQSLLMPMLPGRLPSLARNALNAIYVFDPASPAALEIGAIASLMYAQMLPVRVGLLPVVPELVASVRRGGAPQQQEESEAEMTPSEKMGRLLVLVGGTFGGPTSLTFLAQLRQQLPKTQDGDPGFGNRAWAAAEQLVHQQWAAWGAAAGTAKGRAAARIPPERVIKQALEGSANAEGLLPFLKGAAQLAHSTGVAGHAQAGLLVFNGVITANEGNGWRTTTVQVLQTQLQVLQEDVYLGRLTEADDDLLDAILRIHGSIPRYNPKLLPSESQGPRYVKMSGEAQEYHARQLALTGPALGLGALRTLPLGYFGPQAAEGQEESAAAITHWAVVDAGSAAGLGLASSALRHRSAKGRVGLVVCAADAAALTPAEQALLAAAAGLLQEAGQASLAQLATSLAAEPHPSALSLEALDALYQRSGGAPGALLAALPPLAAQLQAVAAAHAAFAQRALGLAPGSLAVVSNGRVVELGAGDEMEPEDFSLLELYAQRQQYSEQVVQLVELSDPNRDQSPGELSLLAVAVSSALAAHVPEDLDARSSRVAQVVQSFRGQPNSLAVPPASGRPAEEAPMVIQAVLNPLSKAAQQLSPLLLMLREVFEVDMHVTLNPQRDITDLPLKTFYRYALPPAACAAGVKPPRPAAAEFGALPPHKVLTLGMDVPEPWLVEPVAAEHDLDNVKLDQLAPGEHTMRATFELEALLLTGMCLDLASIAARLQQQIHPRGVQLQLGTPTNPALGDTLVMSNLGYFQLKAAPGLWQLGLAPGRSRELYTVASSTGATAGERAESVPSADPAQVPVALSSFSGKHMHLFLRKRPDKLLQDVLEGGEGEGGAESGSLWSKLTPWKEGGGKGKNAAGGGEVAAAEETIHIFTVASGHMYERLQKIMILSALKRTPAPLKFWFIKNYMSPQMKAFVPLMARKYNFQYEFVTYKWPSWLHKQTEKQRIIWAYKILFLDVLFPLGLKKVIFCDSDQVVRADLRELWNTDLQGAPYGYTPFCDTNPDMEGFRFWKQGFWAEHLRGRPYHISALYIIDLERFRQVAAGDRLRVTYDGLARDPNSLANLDQDLPNYAQHSVPIFSLPQEWLWCETWCGSESRPRAKTIDLCNNPLTKEPKLQSARRIIAEWPYLDREAQEFTALAEAVQRGEAPEESLWREEDGLFRVALAPMVEGVVAVTSGSEQEGPGEGASAAANGGSGSGGSTAGAGEAGEGLAQQQEESAAESSASEDGSSSGRSRGGHSPEAKDDGSEERQWEGHDATEL